MTLPRKTGRSLPMALLRAREAVMARFRPLLSAHGMTEQQWRVLRVLHESGPLDATRLANRCCILKPSMTLIVRALVERRLIARRGHAEDGRRMIMKATPKAIALIQKVTRHTNAIYRGIEIEFGRDRVERLLDALEELARLGSQGGPPQSKSVAKSTVFLH
jgi:homoprotocatechuate degradation regulator HpaR